MEYTNTGGLWISSIKKTEKSPDYFGKIKVDRSYLKFLMEQHDEDEIEIKIGGWKRETKEGARFLSLKVDTYVKKEAAPPKDEWEF